MGFNKETDIAILEKEVEQEVSTNLSTNNEEEKKQEAKKTLFSNTPDQYMENLKKNFSSNQTTKKQEASVTPKIQFDAAETFFAKKQTISKKQIDGQVSFSSYYEQENQKKSVEKENVDDESKQNYENIELENDLSNNETENETEISNFKQNEEEVSKIKKPKFKTRLKIICVGAVLVLVCMLGWAIGNAVQIKTLTAEMEQANKIYSVNVVTHISNISKADDLTNPDSIFNLSSLSDAEVIPLQPTTKQPVEYSVKSNWFDRLCNWLSNLFS